MNKPFRFDLQTFADGEPAGENGGNQNPDPASPAKPQGDDLTSKSAEELAAYARELRKAEGSTRSKLDAAEKERKELKAWREERERKDLEEKNEWQKIADSERKKREDSEFEYSRISKAKDERFVRAEVRAAAIKAGIHDPGDVDSLDISDLRISDDGKISGINDLIESTKSAKKHWFKQAVEPNSNRSHGTPPPASGSTQADSKKDWSSVSSEELDREINKLLTTR